MATPCVPADLLKMLGHEVRWQLVAALVGSDQRVNELIERVERPMNVVSYHLRQLWQHGLVHERRSSADGRDVYYSVDLDALRRCFMATGDALHPALTEKDDDLLAATTVGDALPAAVRMLFLCTHNSARSQMAEAIANHLGQGWVQAHSAGTAPSGVNPHAIRAMQGMGIPMEGARSQHVDEFGDQPFDYVITVCDSARESCPFFPATTEMIHWSFPDPSAASGSDAEKQAVFDATAAQLETRIRQLLLRLLRERSD
ncbi:MAG: helix-turn-helix domain-containing protein [Ardenticatenales bacterium]|nr:helix-turn-helix domain-containing protein [Ardenticatenales bacterium]MCB9172551.1 helix-turn-helix domain-containing protein [Ardenticatenales bacterium]